MEPSPEELQKYEAELKAYNEEMERGEWKLKPFNEFLDLVTQKEEPQLNPDSPFCPYCQSKNVINHGVTCTLVGGNNKFDCNHHWASITCQDCNQTYTMEYKGHDEALPEGRFNVWYTKDNRVLRGIPTCFESYIYTCKHCGGDVHRHYYDPGTRRETTFVTYIMGKGQVQETVFSCDKCHQEVYSSNDRFQWHTPHKPREPFNPHGLKWVIKEEIGEVIINDFAMDRLPTK